jgi:type IV secretion system protein VirB10
MADETVDQQETPPRHFNRYYSGRKKLVILAGASACAVGAFFAAQLFLAPSPKTPPPQHVETSEGLGLPFPTPALHTVQPHPAAQPFGASQQLQTQPRQPGQAQSETDPVLLASTEVPDDSHSTSASVSSTGLSTRTRFSPADPPDQDGGAPNDAFSNALVPSNLGGTERARVDTHYLYEISKGRKLHCTLDVAISSELPGPVTCVIKEEVRNDDNSIMLLPAGSHVFGQIQHGVLQGNDRLFILWTEIRTSDVPPIKIPLHSPAADSIGRSGITGNVNTHFLETLLATMAYSIVGAGPQLATAAIENGTHATNNFEFNQLYSPEQSLASRVLENRINRPPTLEDIQGDNLTIFIAQDIDCSGAIHIRLRDQ